MTEIPKKNGQPVGSVEIPRPAIVACPLKGFAMRPMADCSSCNVFGGLEDRFPSMPFDKRYTVLCFGAPVKREIRMLAE